jgi:hypothetical protein
LRAPNLSRSLSLAFVPFVLVYVVYSLPGIARPWGNDHNGFLAKEKSGFAINYLKFGLWGTGLGQKMDEGGTLDSSFKRYSYYVRHPMGISILTAISFRLFGVTEWASRLVAILLNVLILALLYRFFVTYWDYETAILALFFVVFSPMLFYIRHLLAFELLALFFISAILYLYAAWQRTGHRRYRSLLFCAVPLGALLSDWQIYFFVPAIAAHNYFFARRKETAVFLLLPLTVGSFLAYVAYVTWLTGSIHGEGAGGGLWGNMLLRMNLSESASSANISAAKWLAFFVNYYVVFYTPLLGVLTILFFARCIVKLFARRGLTEQEGLLVCSFLAMTSYFAVFSHAYMCCAFMNLFFLPITSLFGATLLLAFARLIALGIGGRMGRVLGGSVVGVCITVFLILSYPRAKLTYAIQNMELPLNTFFSFHKDNIIVNFDEDGSFYQLRPYLQLRTVRRVRTVGDLERALHDTTTRYGFVVLKRGVPDDAALRAYLSARYPSQLIANVKFEEYLFFDLQSGTRPGTQGGLRT